MIMKGLSFRVRLERAGQSPDSCRFFTSINTARVGQFSQARSKQNESDLPTTGTAECYPSFVNEISTYLIGLNDKKQHELHCSLLKSY